VTRAASKYSSSACANLREVPRSSRRAASATPPSRVMSSITRTRNRRQRVRVRVQVAPHVDRQALPDEGRQLLRARPQSGGGQGLLTGRQKLRGYPPRLGPRQRPVDLGRR